MTGFNGLNYTKSRSEISVLPQADEITSQRYRIRVTGIVQGVGFRPYVYNLARATRLSGFVGNDSEGVFIEAQGNPEDLKQFLSALQQNPPPLSSIDNVIADEIDPVKTNGFHIQPSQKGETATTFISPDMALCENCAAELEDSQDRRYLYPFINCTNCGPRYSIIESIPYDRPNTSMVKFTMCPNCQSEYDDPGNRRFHAQPNACPECGPQVTLFNTAGEQMQTGEYAIVLVNKLLKRGHIIAVKGLGGFHLACNAHSSRSVQRLRKRKNREEKPLAIMVRDMATAEHYAVLSSAERELLLSQHSPIVLARKNPESELPEEIAPENPRLGVMLPYTPLHKLLFHNSFDALVMTSGNYSEEPICIDNQDAKDRLDDIADYFLIHNREILQRVDDSVVIELAGEPRLVRRSRGYVPRPLRLNRSTEPILAAGAELKNTLAFSRDGMAFISQHIGDLTHATALDFFHHTRKHLQSVLEIEPQYLVYDLHPGYLSTQWAVEQELDKIGIQHHHAHMASVMAEHHINEPVIGMIMDGTGYGTDGNIWGGEVLVGDYTEVNRFAHIENVPMPGGDKAVKEPWRMGLSYLWKTFGGEYTAHIPTEWGDLPVEQVIQMLEKSINSPLTSSCGRLFDGIAALTGGQTHISFEAQAAIDFEHGMTIETSAPLKYEIKKVGGHYEMPIAPIVRSVFTSLGEGATYGEISAGFHRMLIDMFTELAMLTRKETGLDKVVLSGGVFQNAFLFERVISRLRERNFMVYAHSEVPTNDGGISLGQLAIAQELIAGGDRQPHYTYN